jgi:decaprenyl-phosphate phosphoribosyltransferase
MYFKDIDTSSLATTTIFLDVDGTLVADKGTDSDPISVEKIHELARISDLYLCSNGNASRTAHMAKQLGVRALPRLRKPFPHSAAHSIARGKRIVVIGDKFLTDGLFALCIGATFIKVDRIRSFDDGALTRAAYTIDWIAWNVILYMRLIRPQQWVKNLLVFAPLFFAQALFTPLALTASVATFIAFSLAASSVYIVNDIERDRLHPHKRSRPFASGELSILSGKILFFTLVLLEAILLLAVPALVPILLLYVILNIAYSTRLKHVVVIDILLVASFYLMRVIAGGVATGIKLSPWIILCVFFGALFVIIGKRRAEYHYDNRRVVLEDYSSQALDFMLVASAVLAIMSYGLYTIIGHNSPYLLYTTFFVTLAFFRTLNRMYTHPESAETPEKMLFKDPWIFASFLLWGVSVFVLFYLP